VRSEVVGRLAILDGRTWAAEELGGGLNNATWRVRTTDEPGPALDLVVRHWPEDSPVDHEVERRAAEAAATAGVGAPVRAFQPADHLIALDHVDGAAHTAAHPVGPVVAALRRLHTARTDVPELGLLDLVGLPDGLADALRARPEALVLCHNDLVAANVLHHGAEVTLVDWEYAGLGEPSGEIAGLVVGLDVPPERIPGVVGDYYGEPARQLVARVELWTVVVRLVWADWAARHRHDAWAARLLDQAQGTIDSDDFDRLLEEVSA
jgi:aminoglycoside phosphotransferase (APT) family kinase protein